MNDWPSMMMVLRSCKSDADRARFNELLRSWRCEGAEAPCEEEGDLCRQNTAYADDIRNWRRMCEECQRLSDAWWEEQWQEYYSGLEPIDYRPAWRDD